MKTESEFFEEIERLEEKSNYKELFKLLLKYSRSNNQELVLIAVEQLAYFPYRYFSLDKHITYDVQAIQLKNQLPIASSVINLAVSYRFKGDLQAYKYFLEKSMELNDSSAALDLAILYNISDKEQERVKKLLKVVLNDENSIEIDQEEAEQLLDDIANNRNDLEYLLSKTPVEWRKLPFKEPAILTEELEDVLYEAITNYELAEYNRAFKQLKKLAYNHRIAKAMLYLGDCYHYGKGVTQSYDKAAMWYHEAEKANNKEALLRLADLYKDIRQIALYKHYLEKAREQGSDKATLLLAKLYAITPKEKEKVNSLLQEVINSKTATMDIIYEAELLYSSLN